MNVNIQPSQRSFPCSDAASTFSLAACNKKRKASSGMEEAFRFKKLT